MYNMQWMFFILIRFIVLDADIRNLFSISMFYNFLLFHFFYYFLNYELWFLDHTDGIWPSMKNTWIICGGGRVMWIDILNLPLSFQSFRCWVSRHEHWKSPWCMPILRACAWYPRSISITDNITSVPVLKMNL